MQLNINYAIEIVRAKYTNNPEVLEDFNQIEKKANIVKDILSTQDLAPAINIDNTLNSRIQGFLSDTLNINNNNIEIKNSLLVITFVATHVKGHLFKTYAKEITILIKKNYDLSNPTTRKEIIQSLDNIISLNFKDIQVLIEDKVDRNIVSNDLKSYIFRLPNSKNLYYLNEDKIIVIPQHEISNGKLSRRLNSALGDQYCLLNMLIDKTK